VGDAIGDCFVRMDPSAREKRRMNTAPWYYTDDTVMAKALVEHLAEDGVVDQDALMARFVKAWREDPSRGYATGADRLMREVHEGKPWREAVRELFPGGGSFGNGAAMRVAPLGAWFADDFEALKEQAALSAEVTHGHRDGIDGAVAVALATAWAHAFHGSIGHEPEELFPFLVEQLPKGPMRSAIERAGNIPREFAIETAARTLGNGSDKTALHTVPLCIWLSVRSMTDFEEGIWQSIAAGGDIDTICAIVGGIVIMNTGRFSIPREWLQSREDLRLKITHA
jgi:ADP-ribosylglycohydrolase